MPKFRFKSRKTGSVMTQLERSTAPGWWILMPKSARRIRNSRSYLKPKPVFIPSCERKVPGRKMPLAMASCWAVVKVPE